MPIEGLCPAIVLQRWPQEQGSIAHVGGGNRNLLHGRLCKEQGHTPHVGSHTPREGTGCDFPLAVSKFHRSYRKAPGQNSCNV